MAIPDITRVAVSEHILLGGDNIDLALAVLLEPRLVGERGQISGPQWDHLVASCRDLKEQALSGIASANDQFTVALPGRGSSLVAGAQTATLAREEVERLVLDGFFPACDARARPYRTQAGLRDWGLPYAADSAVTHHLADFLRDRPRVDAVLFNGGSLHAAVLRQRLLEQIAALAGRHPPDRTGERRTRSCRRPRRRTLRQAAARPLQSHRGRCCPRGVPPGADGVSGGEPGGLACSGLRAARAMRQRSRCSKSICRALRCAPTSW